MNFLITLGRRRFSLIDLLLLFSVYVLFRHQPLWQYLLALLVASFITFFIERWVLRLQYRRVMGVLAKLNQEREP